MLVTEVYGVVVQEAAVAMNTEDVANLQADIKRAQQERARKLKGQQARIAKEAKLKAQYGPMTVAVLLLYTECCVQNLFCACIQPDSSLRCTHPTTMSAVSALSLERHPFMVPDSKPNAGSLLLVCTRTSTSSLKSLIAMTRTRN